MVEATYRRKGLLGTSSFTGRVHDHLGGEDGTTAVSESLDLDPQVEAGRANWEWCGIFATSMPIPSDTSLPKNLPLPPNLSQTVLPTGDQVLEYRNL